MKLAIPYLSLRSLVAVILFLSCCTAPKLSGQPGKSTTQWFENKEWLNGLPLVPHETIDQQQLRKQYETNSLWWNKAFNYLKERNLSDLAPGKYLIDGNNVFALVTEGPGKSSDTARWESHQQYIDIHHVLRGKENMGLAPVESAEVVTPYNSATDIGFYKVRGKFYKSDPTMLFIVFPQEAHLPGIKLDDTGEIIKKIVIKVKKTGSSS